MKTKYRFWHQEIVSDNCYDPDRFYLTDPKNGKLLLVQRDEEYIRHKHGNGITLRNYLDSIRYGSLQRNYPFGSGVWSWRDFILPGFPLEDIVSLNEGRTDLFEMPSWFSASSLGFKLFIKMEGRNPSESFKDRGMTVAVSDALRLQRTNPDLGIVGISCASTGDTSAALAIYAGYCRDRLKCVVLLPAGKVCDSQLFQAVAHGADVIAVKHKKGFDGCMELAQEFAQAHPEFVLANSKNDMRLCGQETIGLEILQDLGWQPPDKILIPAGNGGNLTSLMIGLRRALIHGLIDHLPSIVVGQTEAADTLCRWQASGYTEYRPQKFKETVASAMNINDPVSFPRIEELIHDFDIQFYAIKEQDIKDTWMKFMSSGVNICPQSAVALHAGIQARENGFIRDGERVVAISTASGIKFTAAGIAYHKGKRGAYRNPYKIVPGNLKAVEEAIR